VGSDVVLGHGLLRGTIGILVRLTPTASTATCTLLAGLAVVVFAFLPGFPFRLEQYDLPKDVALGILGSVGALHLLASRDADREDRIGFTLAAFLGWGLIAALLVSENGVVAWRTMGLFSAAAAVFLLARRAGRGGASSVAFQGTLLIVGLVCALVLLEAYGGIPFLSAPGRRPGATLGNRNLVARLACMALPLLWIRLVGVDRRATRCALMAALSGALAVIVLSRSRGALLVACGLAVLLPAITRWGAPAETCRRWRAAVITWSAALTLGSTAAVILPNRLGWTVSDFASSASRVAEYQTGTGRGRVIQAATTWRMIRAHPLLGVGPGNWSVTYPAYASQDDPSVILGAFYPGPQTPRSDLLPIVAEWGGVGASLGMLFLLVLGRRTLGLLVSRHEGARLNGVLLLGVVLAATTLGLFDSVLRVAPTVVLLAILAGLSLGHGEALAGLVRSHASWGPRYVWAAACAVVGFLSVSFARSATQDLRALRIINSFVSTKDLARAVRVAPNNVEARGLLSYVLVSMDRCDLARPHLQRAAQLQPLSLFFRTLQARCARTPEKGVDGSPR
jgi:O-antigen ligase